VAAAALAGVAWLAVAPIQEAWLKHQAAALSPAVRLAGGSAIVGPDHQRVAFQPLSVDVHEVSNQQYRYCVEARRCPQPEEPVNDAKFAHGDRSHPVVYVTAYAAAAFCSWLGRRLPTAPEWEWIAGGTHGTRFPWGNTRPKPGQVNAMFNGHQAVGGLVPVDAPAFSRGESPQGVEQLIGNAQEWSATRVLDRNGIIKWLGNWNGRDLADLAVMGGGFQDEVVMDIASAADLMNSSLTNIADGETGFRCVATAQ
jgi:formylglycine-generating enzyme required for sulfatase activity